VRRRAGACLVLLAIALVVPILPVRQSTATWRAGEEAALRDRLQRVRATVQGLEAAARNLAQEARALLPDTTACSDLRPEERAALFDALSQVVAKPRHAIRVGLDAPGVQVFDPGGELVAWAGSPWPEESDGRAAPLKGGRQSLFFRRSGVHTLLSCQLRDPRVGAAAAGDSLLGAPEGHGPLRVVVDIPVEVHYSIHSRFVQSRNLAEELSGNGIAVSFLYETPSVPPYLTQIELEFGGDEAQGTQALALLRDTAGKPLVVCRVTGSPYRDSRRAAAERREMLMRWLLVAALLAGVVTARAACTVAGGARSGRLAASPVWFLALVWSVRLAFAALALPGVEGRLANPATFAMVGAAGLLRSTFDLVLTALACALTAGALFVNAVRHEPPLRRTRVAGLAAGAGGVIGLVWLAVIFVGRVAGNSNPVLLGPQLDLVSLPVAALHTGVLAMVAAWLALAMLWVHALAGRTPPPRLVVVLLALVVLAVLGWRAGWIAAATGVVVFGCGLGLRTLLQDERFTSFGLASFLLVALATTVVSDAVHLEYFRARQARARDTAASVLAPGDDMQRFILEDVLRDVRDDPETTRRLGRSRPSEQAVLAFEIWAKSMLSRLGTSCAVRVYDEIGQPVSEFFVDNPAGPEDPPRGLMMRARRGAEPVIETIPVASSTGPMRFHTGVVGLYGEEPART